MQQPIASASVDADLLIDRPHLPYELDRGVGERARIGLIVLASDQTIEHEFRSIFAHLPGAALYESRIYNAKEILPETLVNMAEGIKAATDLILPGLPLDVVAYACTSGAMVIGHEQVGARIREARPGIPFSTPMAATFAAFRALGARRIAFITPYTDEINRNMRAHILAQGFEVPVMASWNISDDNRVARISERSIREAVLEFGGCDAVDTVFLACTSLRLVDRIEELEAELGKPITSSDHALAWHCVRLAGYDDTVAGLGRLFGKALPQAG